MILNKLADVSRPVRHNVARLITPQLTYNKHDERPMIDFLASQNRTNLIGVEIGVAQGNNAVNILKKLDVAMLYLVDCYQEETSVFKEEDYSLNKVLAFEKLDKLKNTQFIIADSVSATSKIPTDLDFVYIDGDHSYEGIKRDVEAYYPLVKKGGVIGGHDFYGTFPGVVTFVLDWTKKNRLKLYTDNFDWWVIK